MGVLGATGSLKQLGVSPFLPQVEPIDLLVSSPPGACPSPSQG